MRHRPLPVGITNYASAWGLVQALVLCQLAVLFQHMTSKYVSKARAAAWEVI